MTAGSTEYQVGVKLTGDAVDLKTEITSAETAMAGLAQATDTATTDMASSFDKVPAAADTMTTGLVNTSGKKLKGAGKLIGGELVSGLTGELSSGNTAGAIASTTQTLFSSLLLVGGAAALGIGLAGSLVTGFVKAAAAKRQEMIDAVNEGFEAMEIEAGRSGKRIAAEIIKGFEFTQAVEDFGGGDAAVGWERIQAESRAAGVNAQALAELLRQGITPQTKLTAERFAEIREEGTEIVNVNGTMGKQLTAQAKTADEILHTAQLRADYVRTEKELGIAATKNAEVRAGAEREITSSVTDRVSQSAQDADNTERYAAAMQAANQAALELAGRRLPTGSQLAGMG